MIDIADTLRELIRTLDIPVVQSHDPVTNPTGFLSSIKNLEGAEGVIVAWNNGHRCKAKGKWYLVRHKAKDKILRENGVIELILNEGIDDVKPILSTDDRHRLEEFETKFWHGVATTTDVWRAMRESVHRQHGADRKSFALSDSAKTMEGNMKSAIFASWDKYVFDYRGAVIAAIRKNLGTSTKVEAIRGLFGGAKWNYAANTGDE
mgnify:CR=1 FL=1